MERQMRDRGFTLIEILIALALMSIITTAIYQLYISHYKTWVSQDLVTEMQQNARFAIDTMTREMQIMGYNLPANQAAIDRAEADRFTFRSRDLSITSGEQRRQITFKKVGSELQMCVQTWTGASFPASDNCPGDTLAENVTGLEFKYYNDEYAEVSEVGQIRRVRVSLAVQTSRKDPVTGNYKNMSLVTEARPRNLGIGETITDTTPPAVPTGLQVIDPGTCGTLRLRWNNNTEADLSGYIVYYGQAAGDYIGRVNVSTSANAGYDLGGLETSYSDGSKTVTYFIAVAAFDTSGNISAPSSPDVSANPGTSIRAFGAGNDTTINIAKPTSGPAGFTGTSSLGQVTLDWQASTDTNVQGYRIYRKDSSFAAGDYPLADGMMIVNEGTLNSRTGSLTYPDNSPSLVGCTKYYYAIAPVTCDPTLIPKTGTEDSSKYYVESNYSVTYGDGAGSGTDSPADSNTTPRDETDPGTPVIAKRADGSIVSGYKRAYLTVTNPADNDFDYTRVYYSTTETPTVDDNGVVSGGNPVPDSNVAGKGIKGRLEGRDTTVSFVHDSEYDAAIEDVNAMHAPNLTGQRYYYLAVAYDKCGNSKADTAAATTLAELCGDGAVGDPEYGPPDAPTVAGVSGCSQGTDITWNAITASASQNPDAAGYRLYRSPTATFPTTADPATLDVTPCGTSPATACYLGFVPIGSPTTFSDSFSVNDGNVYSYGIVATDCVYENRWIAFGQADYKFNNSRYKQGWLTYNGVRPGKIDRDLQRKQILTRDANLSADVPTTDGTKGYHNVVKLYFKNTGSGTMTLTGIDNIQWDKDTARLAKVTIGGDTSLTDSQGQRVVWTGATPLTSPATNIIFSLDKRIDAGAQYVPIILEFRDSSGAVSDLADMRGVDVKLKLTMTNDSTGTNTCSSYLTETGEYVPFEVHNGPTFDTDDPDTADNVTLPGPTDPGRITQTGTIAVSVPPMPKNDPIKVSASVNSGDIPAKTICSAKVYWKETDKTSTTPPTSWNELSMTKPSGNWEADIDRKRDRRVWFYIVAQDDQDGDCVATTNDRNFDRSPEVQDGYYVYNQTSDPCSETPKKPTGLSLTTAPNSFDVDSSGNIIMQWTAPTKNTDETDILDLAGFNVYEWYSNDGSTWTAANSGKPIANVSGTTPGGTFTYTRSTTGGSTTGTVFTATYSNGQWLKYAVSAYDTCTPTATPTTDKESEKSDESGKVLKGLLYRFTDGTLQGWSADGLWHVSSRRSASALYSIYYGQEATGNFNTGVTNSGYLTSPSITLGATPTLSFNYFLDGECLAGTICTWDKLRVQISDDGGTNWTTLTNGDLADATSFTNKSFNLVTYAFDTVKIRFYFDTIYNVNNANEGAYIDDVDINP